MKVYIGPYKNGYSKWDFVKWIPFISEDTRDKLEKYVPLIIPRTLNRFASEQKIKVKIDYYDTWSVDHTLAHIVLPMLKQLKEDKHGSPYVDDEDVPEEFRLSKKEKKIFEEGHWNKKLKATEEEKDLVHKKFHSRFDWVLDEMIWAFEQKVDPEEGRNSYYVPYESLQEAEEDKFMINVLNDDGTTTRQELFDGDTAERRLERGKYDIELYKKWQERKSNGFRLFGKYFEALWD